MPGTDERSAESTCHGVMILRRSPRLMTFDMAVADRQRGVRVSPPGCREPCGLLLTRRWSPGAGLTLRSSRGPSPPRWSNVVLPGLAPDLLTAAAWSWSMLGPHRIGNRWSSTGTSGHPRYTRTAGERASTVPTSAHEPAWGRVQVPRPAAASPPSSCPRGGGTEDGPHRTVRVEPTAQLDTGSSSAAVPPACHSQRSWPVTTGQPRTTPKQHRPARLHGSAGGDRGRTGFGSKGQCCRRG